jgi:pilus assembly protein FimV
LKRSSTFAGRFALTGVAAAALCLAAPAASALGLGRVQVQSALGEALRAEIDVTSLSPEEASNLRVRIAPPDAYRAAGVEYNVVLPNTQVELLRRSDGRPYFRLTSDRGVQEPFVDVILEINWATGRLVREYTMLFDPPTVARAPAAAVATSPVLSTPVAPMANAEPRALPRAVPPRPATASEPAVSRTPRPTRTAAVPPSPAGDAYRVKAGDSLSKIATRTQRPGVSLDQMLVSLYRGNPQAFLDNNMNRLKAGVVLAVPGSEAASALPPAEARQIVQAQSADFGAYRQRLAGAVPTARAEGSSRQASGKVQAQVDDRKAPAGATPDKLTLSRGVAASAAAASEAQISKDRAKKADDARVAELAKNVEDLKKLSGAASSAAAAPKSVIPTPTAAPPVVAPQAAVAAAPPAAPSVAPGPKIAPLPAPVIVAMAPLPAPVASVSPAAPTPARTASVAGPSSAPVVASATAAASVAAPSRPSASAAPTAAKPPLKAPAPAEEPSMIGSLLDDNPLALGAGGLALALLAGFGVYKFSRRSRRDSGETSFLESRLQPDSFFGASGGQRIDTRDAGGQSSSMSYSLSQLDAIGDVDPVAEADVYLAYGRDLQAEEILKEAMRSSPDRMAIRTKLLEVYAKRRDTKGFELLATQLYALTRGEGEDWAKAQELGAQLDPENPLFRPGGVPMAAQSATGEMIEPLGASTMPQSVLPSPSQFGSSVPGGSGLDTGGMDLDLDLDLDTPIRAAPVSPSAPYPPTAPFAPSAPVRPPPTPAPAPAPIVAAGAPLDFSMSDSFSAPAPAPAKPVLALEPSTFDLSDISLDLDMPATLPAPSVASRGAVPSPAPLGAADPGPISTLSGSADLGLPSLHGDDDDPMSRKLELAEEFRQIGDTDGARDLLHEVVAKATGSTKSRAQSMLAELG